MLQIDVTDQCPLSCVHCSNSAGPNRSNHLPINVLRSLLTDAGCLGAESAVFSGGEPLRHPDIHIAIGAASDAGLAVTLYTTGVGELTSERPISAEQWRHLRGLGLTTATFSVYSSPERRTVHNSIAKSQGITHDAFAVNELAVANARRADLRVEIHFVPCEESASDLESIHAWAARLGCSVLHLQVPTLQGRNRLASGIMISDRAEATLKASLQAGTRSPGPQIHVSRFWRHRWGINLDRSELSQELLVVRSDGAVAPSNAEKYDPFRPYVGNVLEPGFRLQQAWEQLSALGLTGSRRGALALQDGTIACSS